MSTLGAVSDLELIRAFYATFPERIAAAREGVFEPHYSRFYTADHVMEMPDAFPAPGSFSGREGYISWWEEAYGPWTDVVWTLEAIEPVGERVVTSALVRGRPTGDPVDLEVRVAIVYDFRDGRICRSRLFLDHGRALAAARADAAA